MAIIPFSVLLILNALIVGHVMCSSKKPKSATAILNNNISDQAINADINNADSDKEEGKKIVKTAFW